MNTTPFAIDYNCENELKSLGYASIGSNMKIAKNCLIVSIPNISIGNNVIIDSFCYLLKYQGIEFKDYSGLSQDLKVYSKIDDYSGNSKTNPTLPNLYKSIKRDKAVINEHSIIGAGCVILPNVVIGEGASIGTLSLVSSEIDSTIIYIRNPLKKL